MSLKGSAFLALWNDIAPARDAEYNLWHTREHVPERATVPGILSGRRYLAPQAEMYRYFTLYELESFAVLESAAYKTLVDNPTPWSRSMRPDLRNFVRYPCRTLASIGRGMGGAATTLRFSRANEAGRVSPEDALSVCRWLVETRPDLTNAHLGEADLSAPFPIGCPVPPDSHHLRYDLRYVLVVEAFDVAALHKALETLREVPLRVRSARLLEIDTYGLIYAVARADLDDPPTPLPPTHSAR